MIREDLEGCKDYTHHFRVARMMSIPIALLLLLAVLTKVYNMHLDKKNLNKKIYESNKLRRH